jgi:hypothetical protein
LTTSTADGHEHLVHEVPDSPVSRPYARTNHAGKDPVGGDIEDLCTVYEDTQAGRLAIQAALLGRRLVAARGRSHE